MNVPIWTIIKFPQRNRQDSRSLSNETFCRLPVTGAQCNVGTEKYSDTGILVIYDDDDYSQGYVQFKGAFRVLTKDDIVNYIYQIMTSGLRILELMMLVKNFLFSI